jgi:acetoacetate decarboxylase
MGFIKSLEEIAKEYQQNSVFYDAEMLTVYFETTPEVIKGLLPPPLKAAKYPIGGAFVANYPKTNFRTLDMPCLTC